MNSEAKQDMVVQGLASVPSGTALMTWLIGLPIEKWLAAAGFGFILLPAVYLLWRWRIRARHEAERLRNGAPPSPDTTDAGNLR